MVERINTRTLLQMKQRGEKITCLTAYDFSMAKLIDEAGVDIILVGDSLGQVVLGYETTLPVTMDDMLHHVKAVVRGVNRAMVVADMPFMSFQSGPQQALENAARFVKEAGAVASKVVAGKPLTEALTIAVKLEGPVVEAIERIVGAGIPVMGHLGMQPMSAALYGGPRVHGREEAEAERILREAEAVEKAGVFAIVLEKVPASLAERITKMVSVPTIGIGAGPHCDGQVLVSYDMLGLYGLRLKHVKEYAHFFDEAMAAFKAYIEEVKTGKFPGPEHSS